MKRYLLFFGVLFIASAASAQNSLMPFTGYDTSYACSGTLQDHAGSGNYSNYSNGYFVIDPPGSSTVSISFTQFQTESGYDWVRIYDGVGITGTQLGYYTGSTMPNAGNPIVSTSGAMTVRFRSDGSYTTAGFTANWIASGGSTAPSASFTVSNTNPAYNTPVQFTNTSVNQVVSWDFGDGTFSTLENPIHSYTAAGVFPVKLVVSNCAGLTDTSAITNVTVQSAPLGSTTPDTVSITVACGGTGTGSFTIANAGTGNLSYNVALETSASGSSFFESFEGSGTGAFTNQSPGYYTTALKTVNPAQGNQYLEFSGNGNYEDGLLAQIPSATPGEISYHIKPETNGTYNGYVSIGQNNNFNVFNSIFYSYFYYGYMRAYYRTSTGSLTYYNWAITPGDWYEVELKNIDFATFTYDVYINNTLIYAGAKFIYNAPDLNRMHIYSPNLGTMGIDGIVFGGQDISSSLTYTPTSGNVAQSGSSTISITANAAGLFAGTYWMDFVLSSNDTAVDGKRIPLELIVTGDAILNQSATCINKGSVYTTLTYTDSVLVWNSGCDTLEFSGISSTSTGMTGILSPMAIPPYDSTYLHISYTPSQTGSVTDSLFLTGPDTNTYVCINALATSPPVISTDSTSYNVHFVGCPDTVSFPFIIYNTGQSPLNWGTSGTITGNLTDDFESASINTSIWSSWSSGITQGTNCSVINGSKSISFYGSSGARYIQTVPINASSGGTISFSYDQGTCELADNGEGLYVYYSLNNGSTWIQIQYFYTSSYATQTASVAIPPGAQGNNVIFKIQQNSNSGSTYDSWIIDDFSITSGINNSMIFTPDTGAIAMNGSTTVLAQIVTTGLSSGTYNLFAYVNSNDPATPVLSIPVTLTIVGQASLNVPSTCTNADSIMMGLSTQDSVLVFNDGCADLLISNVTTATSQFAAITTSATIAPGDTGYFRFSFSPTTIGLQQDSLTLMSNLPNAKACISGYGLGAPNAVLDTSMINVTINGCDDSVLVHRTIYNTGLAALNYQIGELTQPTLQDVLDTFKASYSSLNSLIPNRYDFLDGITGYYIYDGGLDMYDYGNYVSTNLLGGSFYYSNDYIATNYGFGTGGQYFTYKGTGIWLMAADMNGVSTFDITGGAGDGLGIADGTVLTANSNGKTYKGFVKRVYNATIPSVNHLIIVEDNGNLNHTFNTNTNYDDHSVTGLMGSERIYYLLFSSQSGGYVNNSTMQSIMNKFLSMANGSGTPFWIDVAPDSAQVSVADSVVLDIWIKSDGLTVGTHQGNIGVITNDPFNPIINIPVSATVVGNAEIDVTANCLAFDSILVGLTDIIPSPIFNTGCDTLVVTGTGSTTGHFSIMNLPLKIAPEDSVLADFAFIPNTMGYFQDTLFIYSNADTVSICVNGEGLGAPQVTPSVDTMKVTLNLCDGFVIKQLSIQNTGQGSMTYEMEAKSLYHESSSQNYTTFNALTTHSFTNTPATADTVFFMVVVNGDYNGSAGGEYYNASIEGSYVNVYDNNAPDGTNDTSYGYYTGPNIATWLADGKIDFNIQNAYGVAPNTGLDLHYVELWIKSTPVWLSILSPKTGTLGVGSTTTKNLLFTAGNLGVGTYESSIVIESDDPVNPIYTVPVILTIVDKPVMEIKTNCINYGQVTGTAPITDSVMVYNTGCKNLNITNLQFLQPQFSSSITTAVIPANDSLWIPITLTPTTPGPLNSSVIIYSNDTNLAVCLTANIGFIPVADYDYSVKDECEGEVEFNDNTTFNPVNWTWDFGDGGVSYQQNPTHIYQKPGIYNVQLIAWNTTGSDTTVNQIDMSKVLYVDFSRPDTIRTNAAAQFYDSSLVATSWQWFFGDGGTSTAQNPVHTYSNAGTYFVTFIASNADCSTTVNRQVTVYGWVGLEEVSTSSVMVYPVPASDFVIAQWDENESYSTASIVDATGKTIHVFELEQERQIKVDVSAYAEGMYMIQLQSKKGAFVYKKFVVAR